MKREHFLCDCKALEHTIRFSYENYQDGEDDNSYLYIEMFLNKHSSFFKRVWTALKYVFSKNPSRYGDVGEYVINEKTARDMKEFIDDYLTEIRKKRLLRIISIFRRKQMFKSTELFSMYKLALRFEGFSDLLELWYNEEDEKEKEKCFGEIWRTLTELKKNLDIGMSEEDTDWIVM